MAAAHSSLFDIPFERYVEPFLGGGAIYFHLQPKSALLADVNPNLIDCYRAVRLAPTKIEAALRRHQKLHSTTYYYEERSRKRRSLIERAAQMLYLNRTCWNGLYRVNLLGEFNVPIGTKTSVVLPSDNFKGAAQLLRGAELVAQDFEKTIGAAERGDFLFVDPPYTVKHNMNGFLKYNESIFSWDDQRRLHSALLAAKARGARILVTNANHESVKRLYRGFGASVTLMRSSVLAGDARFRGPSTEIAFLV
jgi:DNA adenine methylase